MADGCDATAVAAEPRFINKCWRSWKIESYHDLLWSEGRAAD